MKNLLCPTDFSETAMHATQYAYHLAKLTGADLLLCNAITLPAYAPQAGVVVWPAEEEDLLIEDSRHELNKIKKIIDQYPNKDGAKPVVHCVSEAGSVKDVVNRLALCKHIDLIVAGTHGAGGFSTLMFGNHTRQLIDSTVCPLLLVPSGAEVSKIKKIAFATDFSNPENDLACLYTLIALARPLQADILLTHIFHDEHSTAKFNKKVDHFITEISNKADYPHIYYRKVKDIDVESGLLWLCEHGQIDMLTMIHKSHNFVADLFKGSQTKKISDRILLPLLVFPEQHRQAEIGTERPENYARV
jgi:nucleotide-binding universal stress UspA family protein